MADYTVTIDLPDHKRGDEWIGFLVGPVLVDGATPAEQLSRVRMNFFLPGVGSHRFVLDSDNSADRDAPITITNATLWVAQSGVPGDFEIDEFVQYAGDWHWDMAFWRGDKVSPRTFYKGVLRVTEDV
jgi:hypothetical protein